MDGICQDHINQRTKAFIVFVIFFFRIYLQERTVEEHQRMIKGILKRDEKRRNRIKAAGVEYECPDLVSESAYLFELGRLSSIYVVFISKIKRIK